MWTVKSESNILMLLERQHYKTLQSFCRNRFPSAPFDKLLLTPEDWRYAFAEGQGCRDVMIDRIKECHFSNLKRSPQLQAKVTSSKFSSCDNVLLIAYASSCQKIEIRPNGVENATVSAHRCSPRLRVQNFTCCQN